MIRALATWRTSPSGACTGLRERLEEQPTLEGLELRFTPVEAHEALRMYRETDGYGYVRWVPVANAEPLAEGEQAFGVLFLPKARE